MKMTEDEAIARLRGNRENFPHREACPCKDCEAIRTVCDALECARRAVPVGYVVLPSECDERMIGAFNEYAAAGNEYPDTFLAALVAAAPAQPAPMPWQCHQQQSAHDRRMVDIVRHLSMYPATRADEMTVESIRAMCRDAVAIYDGQPATETAGDARLSNEPYRSRALVAMQKVYDEAPRVTVYTLADMLDAAILAAQGVKS